MNSCVLQGVLADRHRFRNSGVQVSIAIREFHLNHLDVLHNATHPEIALAMDLHQYKTWHWRGILAQFQVWTPRPPPSPPGSGIYLSMWMLTLCWSVLISGGDTAQRGWRTGRTSTAPCECVWKAQIEPFPQSPGRFLIVGKFQSRLCIICKILCWYCKWGLIVVEAQLSFIM